MEDVLDLDATSKQLMAETRVPLPSKPGKAARYDYKYQHNGTRNLLLFCPPQVGWRVVVPAQRPMEDLAEHMSWLVDVRYPEAEKSRVVLDNLNTHTPALLSEAFASAEARRIVQKLALHDTPKHGSGLTMADIELRLWQRQCLERRLPDEAMLTREIAAYEDARNAAHATIQWRCTTTAAREKLHRLYPSHPKRQASRSHRATSVLGLIC
jgi:hypothetical protein